LHGLHIKKGGRVRHSSGGTGSFQETILSREDKHLSGVVKNGGLGGGVGKLDLSSLVRGHDNRSMRLLSSSFREKWNDVGIENSC